MRMHGHNYLLRVMVSSAELDKSGFVVDYGDLAPVKTFIDSKLDHQILNDVLAEVGGPSQPSAENLAEWMVGVTRSRCAIPESATVSVGVSETPKTWAWFEEESDAEI